LTLKQMR